MGELVLELEGVSKRYGDVVALDRLAMAVGAGEVFGFVGPNGAGKTTTMRIVLGVLEADSGEVSWRGAPITREDRQRIGYMPEERGLYPKMKVGEQLSYLAQLHGLARDDADAKAARWLERLGVGERAGDNVEALSLGNQQRVQLAAALVHEPDLLVLDEPFSGLDPVGVEALSEVLVDVARNRGVPVIFSSHQLELVERLCDAVAIIRDGSLVASGPLEKLRAERSRRRWRAEVDGAAERWWERVAGATPVGDDGLYELAPDADPQALLDAARAAGSVRRFHPEEPSLAELFRETLAAPKEEAG